jgi:hypothetical protein
LQNCLHQILHTKAIINAIQGLKLGSVNQTTLNTLSNTIVNVLAAAETMCFCAVLLKKDSSREMTGAEHVCHCCSL